MQICIDARENALIPIIKSLKDDLGFECEIIIEKLDIGDIIIKDCDQEKMIIERKTLNDLASSLRDGRYREQSYRLNGTNIHNHNIVYLIEGEKERYTNRFTKVPYSTLMVTMFCIQYYKGFSLFKTRHIVETAEYILRITDKIRREKKKKNYYDGGMKNEKKTYTDVVKREKKANIRPDNVGEIILSQIPGISSKSSKSIMSNFNSLYDLLIQLKEDKKCLDNIELVSANGNKRRISQTVKNNIIKYLLYQKNDPEIIINI
jgi:ERCC4-type nuclease